MKESTVITVTSTELDQYGNLMVTDTMGGITRINKKHEDLHQLFQENEGKAIKLIWANFKNVDYVDDAELFDGKPPVEKQGEHITAGVEKPKEPAPQAVGMTTKLIGDLIMAGKLKEIFGADASVGLIEWFRGQVLGITRIEFDGAKLPKFKKEE